MTFLTLKTLKDSFCVFVLRDLVSNDDYFTQHKRRDCLS